LESPGQLAWFPPGRAGIGDVALAARLRNPEWPFADLMSFSRVQGPLRRRWVILVLAAAGLLAGLLERRERAMLVAFPMVGWVLSLLALMPRSIYLTMPLGLAFVFLGPAISFPARRLGSWIRSRRFSPRPLTNAVESS
jgi:hypothetical protein